VLLRENAAFSIARTRCRETQCSLFPIYCRLPKLDVAGSNPVSRSKINNLQTAQKHTLHSPPLRITRPLSRPNSFGENRVLKLLRGGRPILHTRLGVHIESYSNAMPALVC
jgi:hypothetical protein